MKLSMCIGVSSMILLSFDCLKPTCVQNVCDSVCCCMLLPHCTSVAPFRRAVSFSTVHRVCASDWFLAFGCMSSWVMFRRRVRFVFVMKAVAMP
jgi:hypothetical protein